MLNHPMSLLTMIKTRTIPAAFRPLAVVALCSATFTGCLRTLESEGNLQKFGAVVVLGKPGVEKPLEASASAIFFQAYSANVPSSGNQPNTCRTLAVDTVTRPPTTGQLRAGESLSMQVGTETAIIDYLATPQRYESPGYIPYAAGDSITVTVPGSATGFPAAVIKTRLAEPLIVPDITLPELGSSMSSF